jgi:hypothetical protein
VNERPNGADVMPITPAATEEDGGLTFEQLCSLTVGQLLAELDRTGEPLLLLEAMFLMNGPESDPKFQPGSNIGVMVTRDVGYIEHVKSRMRREAKKKHETETKSAQGEQP